MSLFTRCPHCRTTFKVVADQLRISDGWVRCGQCQQVFDASQHLQTPPSEPMAAPPQAPAAAPAVATAHVWSSARTPAPPPATPSVWDGDWPEPAPGTPGAPDTAADPGAHRLASEDAAPVPAFLRAQSAAPDTLQDTSPAATQGMAIGVAAPPADEDAGQAMDAARMAAHAPLAQDAAPGAEPFADNPLQWPGLDEAALQRAVDAQPAGGLPQSAPDAELPPPSDAAQEEPPPAPAPEAEPATGPEVEEEYDPTTEVPSDIDLGSDWPDSLLEPGFVRSARRQALWRRPAVRALLGVAALALALLLALQVALHERDLIAARYPQARPWLQQLCDRVGCTLQPLRRIDAMLIDHSSFVRLRTDSTGYRLQWGIRNSADLPLAMPALELTLTDAQDRPLLRRVLRPAEVGAPQALDARQVWQGQLGLRVSGDSTPVAGYRLLVFYGDAE